MKCYRDGKWIDKQVGDKHKKRIGMTYVCRKTDWKHIKRKRRKTYKLLCKSASYLALWTIFSFVNLEQTKYIIPLDSNFGTNFCFFALNFE